LRPLDLIARATAAGEAEDAEAAVKRLVSDDAATRRNARDALVALGPPAVAAMVQALRADPNDYRLRSGVVLSLAEMLRAHEDKRADIAAALTADDLAALVATAGSDKDPTLRLQATDFLYRLKDPRTVAPALDAAKKASGPTEQYNSTLILKGTAPALNEPEQKRVIEELSTSIPAQDVRSRKLIESFGKF
jgi:HEAT repeat protein